MSRAVYTRMGKTRVQTQFIYTPTQMASSENFSAMGSVFIYLRGRGFLLSETLLGTGQVDHSNDQEIFSLLKPLTRLPWKASSPVRHAVFSVTKSAAWKIQA
jgi:hypothetical protein